jgi:hypothetical protein
MNTTIFGTDYVGLITGACPADMGHRVICVDMDHTKRERERDIRKDEPGYRFSARLSRTILFTCVADLGCDGASQGQPTVSRKTLDAETRMV